MIYYLLVDSSIMYVPPTDVNTEARVVLNKTDKN